MLCVTRPAAFFSCVGSGSLRKPSGVKPRSASLISRRIPTRLGRWKSCPKTSLADKKECLSHWDAVNKRVHDTVVSFGWSISAEHGISLLTLDEIRHYRHPVDQRLLDSIKKAIDPAHSLNPGKLI